MRLAIVGAGRMARERAAAFRKTTPELVICGVAARTQESAARLASELGCQFHTASYRELITTRPDALLIEVPHKVQDEVALWALEHDLHCLIGGCLASDLATAKKIVETATHRHLVVEAGYEARYKAPWLLVRSLLQEKRLGEVISITSTALYSQDPHSWYYDEHLSGGMLVTHASYAFLNPLRWLFGYPLSVTAMSNRVVELAPGRVKHETCIALLRFAPDIVCSVTATYVKPPALDGWMVRILGADACLDLEPGDTEPGCARLIDNDGTVTSWTFGCADGFDRQIEAFVGAIKGHALVKNAAGDACLDIRLCEEIDQAARAANKRDAHSAKGPLAEVLR